VRALLIIIFSFSAFSYPIFFKCSEDSELIDSFSEKEEKELAKKLNYGQCNSVNQCMDQFKQLLELNTESSKITNAIFHVYSAEIREIGQDSYKLLSDKHKAFKALRMCHRAQQVNEDTNSLSLYYPHETTYQYITGYRKNNPNNYKGFSKPYRGDVKNIIDESIAVGVDPFAVLGMAMMERAGGELHKYYSNMHDKRSQLVLGCDIGKFTSNGMPQIAKRSEQFNDFASKLEIEKNSKEHYVCVGRANDKKYIDDTKGFETYGSLTDAKKFGKTCCVKTKHEARFNAAGRRVTSFMYFDQIQNKNHYNPMAKDHQDSIEHRLNTFLGMSYTVGTYPSYRISPYRVGVNSFEDPNYGRQIMDYMLNSFMRNGEVMQYIRDAEKKYNKKRKSLLCFNRKAGSYIIDSDFYLNKIKNTQRMKPIKALFDKGRAWSEIGIKYQSVLLQEFTYYKEKINKDSAVYNKFKKYMSKSELLEFDKAAKHLYEYRNASIRRTSNLKPLSRDENKVFDKMYRIYFSKPEFYEHRRTLVNAAKEDTGLSWSKASDQNIKLIKERTKSQ